MYFDILHSNGKEVARKTDYKDLTVIAQPVYSNGGFSEMLLKIISGRFAGDKFYCGRFAHNKLFGLEVGDYDRKNKNPGTLIPASEELLQEYGWLLEEITPVLDELPEAYREVLPEELLSKKQV